MCQHVTQILVGVEQLQKFGESLDHVTAAPVFGMHVQRYRDVLDKVNVLQLSGNFQRKLRGCKLLIFMHSEISFHYVKFLQLFHQISLSIDDVFIEHVIGQYKVKEIFDVYHTILVDVAEQQDVLVNRADIVGDTFHK